MKTLQHITVLLFLLIFSNVFSQENSIQTIKNKYNTLLQEQNKGIGVLIKKGAKISTFYLGSHQLTSKKVFNIGSATKTFTAILFLQEVEKGNLKLTDSIGKYLSPIKNVDGALTIETLLTHQSGLDEVVGENIKEIYYSKNDALLNSNLLDEIEENNPEQIGKFNYCNTNYLLLGKIIEKVTDKNYFDLVRECIIEPLNMKHTYPYVSKNIKNLATPFSQGEDISKYLDYRYFANIANAAGSIASTLSDMEVFYTSLFETEKLLKNETLQLMLTSGNEIYGLGIFKSEYNGTPYYGHGGNNIGYAFSNGYNPKTKELYLMFSNEIMIPIKSIENDVFAYLNNEAIENFKHADINNFKDYIGSYLIKEANFVIKIKIENNKILLGNEAQGFAELNQKNENTLIEKNYRCNSF